MPREARAAERSQYLDAARAAYENAVAVKDDAALLFKRKRYARAAALAVTGLEETGKALVLWFVGIGRVQESRRAEVLKVLRSHKKKQATALPLRVIGEVIPLARRLFTFKIPTPRARPKSWVEVERAIREMLPTIVDSAQALVNESSLATGLASIEQEAGSRLRGDLELQRQKGLYADVDAAAVTSPAGTTRAEAGALLRDLRACLLALKPLTDVAGFGDEGVDGVLAAGEMHDRIWTSVQSERASS